jgi:hypothetical protein
MTNRDTLEKIKAFGMTNQIITEEIQAIGIKYSHDFGHLPKSGMTSNGCTIHSSPQRFELKPHL